MPLDSMGLMLSSNTAEAGYIKDLRNSKLFNRTVYWMYLVIPILFLIVFLSYVGNIFISNYYYVPYLLW
jgi:hypothetical protein